MAASELLHAQLAEFVKADEAARTPVPPALYDVIREAAASNQTSFAWSEVQVLLDAVFCEVLAEFEARTGTCPPVDGEPFVTRLARVRRGLKDFERPPFTLQRICEILLNPRMYRNTDKLFAAVSKTVVGIRLFNDDVPDDDGESYALPAFDASSASAMSPPFMSAWPASPDVSGLEFAPWAVAATVAGGDLSGWGASAMVTSPRAAGDGHGASGATFLSLLPAPPPPSLGMALISSQMDDDE